MLGESPPSQSFLETRHSVLHSTIKTRLSTMGKSKRGSSVPSTLMFGGRGYNPVEDEEALTVSTMDQGGGQTTDEDDSTFSDGSDSDSSTVFYDMLEESLGFNSHKTGKTGTTEKSDQILQNVCKTKKSTPLFRAMEEGDWKSVLTFLQSGKFSASSGRQDSKMARPQDQVRTWVSMYRKPDRLLWRRLPLHYALSQQAPLEVIEMLLRLYPIGVETPDSEGNLPLHHAMKHSSDNEVIGLVFQEHPNAIEAVNGKGLLPFECFTTVNGEDATMRGKILQQYLQCAKAIASQDIPNLKDELLSVTKTIESAKSELRLARVELGFIKKQKKIKAQRKEQEEIQMKSELAELRSELEELRNEKEKLYAEKEHLTQQYQKRWDENGQPEDKESQANWIASEFNQMAQELESSTRLAKSRNGAANESNDEHSRHLRGKFSDHSRVSTVWSSSSDECSHSHAGPRTDGIQSESKKSPLDDSSADSYSYKSNTIAKARKSKASSSKNSVDSERSRSSSTKLYGQGKGMQDDKAIDHNQLSSIWSTSEEEDIIVESSRDSRLGLHAQTEAEKSNHSSQEIKKLKPRLQGAKLSQDMSIHSLGSSVWSSSSDDEANFKKQPSQRSGARRAKKNDDMSTHSLSSYVKASIVGECGELNDQSESSRKERMWSSEENRCDDRNSPGVGSFDDDGEIATKLEIAANAKPENQNHREHSRRNNRAWSDDSSVESLISKKDVKLEERTVNKRQDSGSENDDEKSDELITSGAMTAHGRQENTGNNRKEKEHRYLLQEDHPDFDGFELVPQHKSDLNGGDDVILSEYERELLMDLRNARCNGEQDKSSEGEKRQALEDREWRMQNDLVKSVTDDLSGNSDERRRTIPKRESNMSAEYRDDIHDGPGLEVTRSGRVTFADETVVYEEVRGDFASSLHGFDGSVRAGRITTTTSKVRTASRSPSRSPLRRRTKGSSRRRRSRRGGHKSSYRELDVIAVPGDDNVEILKGNQRSALELCRSYPAPTIPEDDEYSSHAITEIKSYTSNSLSRRRRHFGNECPH